MVGLSQASANRSVSRRAAGKGHKPDGDVASADDRDVSVQLAFEAWIVACMVKV
jgi:hypothetical protein